MSAPEASPFDAPWQAEAFALAILLNERGLFTWGEWTEVFGAELKAGPQAAGNDVYYGCWLNALEKLLVAKGIASPAALADLARAWRDAAAATPHGQPIVLAAANRRID